MFRFKDRVYNCQIEFAFRLISGKWKTDILWELHKQPDLRFNELQRRLCNVTAKVLAKQLDALEDALLVSRTAYPEVPLRVEYRLTTEGESLWALCEPLIAWSDGHVEILKRTEADLRARAETEMALTRAGK
jgi:DNA-binding HxlR family transcriptional regulator